ncbi:MAG: small basic protein [Planctomycetota bacterium]|jgi:small basic protein (TIGR04137 family)|nr:small basic protein [Planctomycetota bacterium]
MTMDKSLRVRMGSSAARGVLTRAERIVKLKEQERWGDGLSPLGLPKVRVYKMAMKKKKKAKEEGADATAGKAPAGKAAAGKAAAGKGAAGAAKKK